MATETWRNWAKTQTARPTRIERPRGVDEVVRAVSEAARDGLSVRPVGSGFSLTGLAVTDGVMLDLSGLDRLRSVDAVSGVVVVEAGIRLRRLWDELWRHGLAVQTLGGQDRQSLGGAIATGEHGTGLRFGGLAAQVRELELVMADGSLVTCSERERPELFQAARVGLGAFGVVTAVTLAAGPACRVVRRDERVVLDRLLDEADELLEAHDHVEFSWHPAADGVVRTTVDQVPDGAPRPSYPRWRAVLDGERIAAGVWRRRGPSAVARARRAPVSRTWRDRPYRALGLRPSGAVRESEYAVPRACFGAAFDEVRDLIRADPRLAAAPLRVRFGAAEDAWLAMSAGRETCYLSVEASRNQPYEAMFSTLESIAARYDGRPHWGRLHGLRANTLRSRYPRFDDAREVRTQVDPERRFTNPHLQLLLGD